MKISSPFSLRVKLLLASIFVEAIMLSLLVTNSLRLSQDSLQSQAIQRNHELTILFNAALAAPMAARDYATINEILTEITTGEGIVYMVLTDQNQHRIASAGWNSQHPLPKIDDQLNFRQQDARLDLSFPITLAGHTYGTLSYGLSTKFLTQAQSHLLRQSMLIAAIEIILSFLLLAALGYLLTRHLMMLTNATKAVANGNFDVILPVKTEDEIGLLTRTFNTMSATIKTRIDELRVNESKFHAIADYTYGWESWLGTDGKLVWVNPSVVTVTGYTVDECMRMTDYPSCLAVREDMERVQSACLTAVQGNSKGEYFEFQLQRKNGSVVWIVVFWQSIYGENGEAMGIRTSMLDITERKEAEILLRNALAELKQTDLARRSDLSHMEEERARLVALLSAMNMGILFVNAENQVTYYNPTFLRLWLIPIDTELTGKSAEEVLNYSGNILARPDHFSKHILNVLETHEVSDSFEITMADGRIITQLSYPVRDNEGRFIGRLWIYEDITRERQTAEQLIYLAERDSLTGLFNRRRLQEELTRLLAISNRHQTQGALIFFDLDEFKYVNDTFGHRAGDTMLIRIAGEVGALVRRNEILSRLGGDEFALLMPDATEKEAEVLAERVVRAISQIPFRFEGQNFRLTTSLGIAFYPQHAVTTEDLIAHADAAMYQAKDAGKNTWRKYRPDLDTSREMVNRLTWNDRIGSAFEKNLLRLHFQGIYHANSGELAHLEVLVRMMDEQDPDRIIMPGHFIPHAEKSGQILDIDRWVIRKSIALLAKSKTVPSLAVNISGRSFDEPTLPHYITEQLQLFNVEPHRLLIELTETSAVSDLQDAERFIEALHKTGCTTCLDDFGTGFSSFAYLKHLKADVLKIDGLFIRDLPNERDNQVFVKSIVDVARGLGKKTVAEFVENADILKMLQAMGVDMVQGYHLDKPQEHHPSLTLALTEASVNKNATY